MGNVTEILTLLDKDKWSGEELQQNYNSLVEKWGEWELVNEGMAGMIVRYVDVGNALFSGLAVTYMSLTFISLLCAILFGKIIFPLLSKHYKNTNDELVDIATLQSAQQINDMSKKNKEKKEWF